MARPLLLTPAVLLCLTLQDSPDAVVSVRRAAERFLAAVPAEGRGRVVFPFGGELRRDWHFVPKRRPGLSFKEMTLAQRRAAHRLLRSALSAGGYLKVTSVMALEAVLREIEGARHRDEELYWFAFFGEPSPKKPWAWRFEGHHVSLSFTCVGGRSTVTPAFLGANPAEVRTGPRAGLRVLGPEEDLARSLLRSLDAGQRRRAIVAERAPRDVIMGPQRDTWDEKPAGVPGSGMSEAQRARLRRLLDTYVGNVHDALGRKQRARVTKDLDKVWFAWAGGTEPGQGHYYRIQGPEFVIEYDNTQNRANHVHTVWRDLEGDFGRDLLREHHERHEHK